MRKFHAILVGASFVVVALANPKPQGSFLTQYILDQNGQDSDKDTVNANLGSYTGTLVSPAAATKKVPNYGLPVATVVDSQENPCSFYADAGYNCVPYYQCSNGTIVVDGGGLFDIRKGFLDVTLDPDKSKCPGDLQVCCLHPGTIEKAPVSGQRPPEVPVTVSPPASEASSERPQTTPEIFHTDLTLKKYSSKCGQRNYGGVGVKILKQKQDGLTQFGEWPHMCAVLNRTIVNKQDANHYVCGCSLISDRIALTAAHCVNKFSANEIKVRAGEWDTQQTVEPHPHQDRKAKHISIHPGFSLINLQNDFALIHLSEPFVLSPHIDLACLPDNLNFEGNIHPEKCVATGWGKDRFGKPGEYQVILKRVQLDLVPHNDCETKLRGTRLGQFFDLDKSFTCAGGKLGKDTCTGDGGGPLVCPSTNGDSYVQVGIVAWGIGCGDAVPGVYANVSQALCFIDWATKCVEGQNANFYGFSGCDDWARTEYCSLKRQMQALIKQKKEISTGNSVEREKNKKEIRKLGELIPQFEDAINQCSTGVNVISCEQVNGKQDHVVVPEQRDVKSVNNTPRTVDIETVDDRG